MKKVEMHAKTKYSMDHESTIDIKSLILKCIENGEKAVTLVDTDSVISFIKAEKIFKEIGNKDFKLIYGVELNTEYLGKKYKIVILLKNKKGISKLYRILSPYWTNKSLFLDELIKYREYFVLGLLYDQSNYDDSLIQYFDYIEVNKNTPKEDIKKLKKKILVIFSNRINALSNEEALSKKVLYHKLNIKKEISNRVYQTTREMLNEIGDKEIVVDNPNKINEMIDKFEIDEGETFLPTNNDFDIDLLVRIRLNEKYKNNIPVKIIKRVEEELKLIHEYNYDGFINLYKKITDKCKEESEEYVICDYVNYLYIAYLLGITHFNPIKMNFNYEIFFSHYAKISIKVSTSFYWDLSYYIKNDLGINTIKCKSLMKLNNYMLNITMDKYEEINNIKLTDKEKVTITKYLDDYPISNRAVTSKEFILPENFSLFELSPRELLNDGNVFRRFINIDYKDIEHKFLTLELISTDKVQALNELKEMTRDNISNCNYKDKKIIKSEDFQDYLKSYDSDLMLDDLYESLVENGVELPDIFNIINEIRNDKIISKNTKDILNKFGIKLKKLHDIKFISRGILYERMRLEYELIYFKIYYPLEYYYVMLKSCPIELIEIIKQGYDEVVNKIKDYPEYRYEYNLLNLVKELYESNIEFRIEERFIVDDFYFELDKENERITLIMNKDNRIIDKYLSTDLSLVGTRPGDGKMNYMSKIVLKLLDINKKILLFGFDGPTTYYVEYLLSYMTEIERRNIHQYLNPCANGIDELLSINQEELLSAIKYLLVHNLEIRDYHTIDDLIIKSANTLLDKMIEIIDNSDSKIIIVDDINGIFKDIEKVLNKFKKIAQAKDIRFIIFDNLKREYEVNKVKEISSFENEQIMDKYISYISILDNENLYELKEEN